jgi:hypothetical protein
MKNTLIRYHSIVIFSLMISFLFYNVAFNYIASSEENYHQTKMVMPPFNMGNLTMSNITTTTVTTFHNITTTTITYNNKTITDTHQWIPYTPLPEQVKISINTKAGITFVNIILTFPNTGFRVIDWGYIQKEGNKFYLDTKIEEWTGPSALMIINFSRGYELGNLSEGIYIFIFKSWGKTVKTQSFNITKGESINITKTERPVVIVYPSLIEARKGSQFILNVSVIPKGYGISGSELTLKFDPDNLKVIDVIPGDLLGISPLEGIKQIDNVNGTLIYALSRTGDTIPPTPNGTLASILFKVLPQAKVGEYTIQIIIKLSNETFKEIKGITIQEPIVRILPTLLGDINGDGIVDYRDLAILGSSYGKSRGEAGYKDEADLNDDGIVDYRDLAILGANYGRTIY